MTNFEGNLCDACGLYPAMYGNTVFLGSEDRLCLNCFADWYDGGICSRSELRANRLAGRNMFPVEAAGGTAP